MAVMTSGSNDAGIANIISNMFSSDNLRITDIELHGDFSEILLYVQENFSPEDVFDNGELDDWAIEHGYIKEEEK